MGRLHGALRSRARGLPLPSLGALALLACRWASASSNHPLEPGHEPAVGEPDLIACELTPPPHVAEPDHALLAGFVTIAVADCVSEPAAWGLVRLLFARQIWIEGGTVVAARPTVKARHDLAALAPTKINGLVTRTASSSASRAVCSLDAGVGVLRQPSRVGRPRAYETKTGSPLDHPRYLVALDQQVSVAAEFK